MRAIIQINNDLFCFMLLLLAVALIHSSEGVDYDDSTYGTDWVYFLDTDGNKQYVDMTVSLDNYKPMPIDFEKTRKSGDDYTVNFWLYTRNNINDYQVLLASDLANDLKFIVGKPMVMVTHGWKVNGLGNATQLIKNAHLEQHDVNVVVVDWGDEASAEYPVAALKLTDLATKVGDMVTALSKRYAFDGSSVHLIGHSLGAHLMGLAGAQLKKGGFIVERVTGLDPARPFFEFPPLIEGISTDSAAFVDIIHTNIDILGITNAGGHADFYPNGGHKQSACCGKADTKDLINNICDHGCSYVYYEESIKYDTFKARKCDDYYQFLWGSCDTNEESDMGELSDPSARGTFYLKIDKLPSNT